MSKPISRVVMSSFRGASTPFDLTLDPEKDITMVFGENGSGKSSILDAIDIAINGGNGSLDGISVGANPSQYLCTLGLPPATLATTVYSGEESWSGTIRGRTLHLSGSHDKPIVKTLRRNKILTLVLATPGERYNALKSFIDISVIEQSENTLKRKIDITGSDITKLIADKNRQQSQLESVWKSESQHDSLQNAMEWAESKLSTGIEDLKERLYLFKQVVVAIVKVVNANNDYHSKKSIFDTRQRDLVSINQQIESSPELKVTNAIRLIESLTKVKEYIDIESQLDKCPTCQRPMDRDDLISIVDGQLSELKELKELNDQKNAAQSQLDTATKNLTEAESAFLVEMQEFQKNIEDFDIPEISALKIDWPDWSASKLDFTILTGISNSIEQVNSELEKKRESTQIDINQFTSIEQWYKGIVEASEEITNNNRILTGMQRAYDIVHAKRIFYVQSVLNDISQEANRLFQAIHPDENIGLDKLQMDEFLSGSVTQAGVFDNHPNIIPQAFFSESHLDTLGFCVWLALAKKDDAENTVLLIDDVFTSVDSPHLGRIIDLLAAESSNFLQVIISTHFRLWCDRCQNANSIQRIQLGLWTSDNGIVAKNMPLVTKQLRDLVNSPILDRQAVSSKAGILLEEILDGLALLYQRSLPRNHQNLYTLGALINSCKKLFTKNNLTVNRNINWNTEGLPENWQTTDGKAAFDRIDKFQFIRNQVGCHFNPPGADIPDNEVRDFGQATVDLVEAITCPNCGYIATKPMTDGASLRCSCQKRAIQMTPVTVQ